MKGPTAGGRATDPGGETRALLKRRGAKRARGAGRSASAPGDFPGLLEAAHGGAGPRSAAPPSGDRRGEVAVGAPRREVSPEARRPDARRLASGAHTSSPEKREAGSDALLRGPGARFEAPAGLVAPALEPGHPGAAPSAAGPVAPPPPLNGPAPPVDASHTLLQLALADASLTVDVHQQVVNLALHTEATGALELELRLQDGRAHVWVSGPSAPLVAQHAPALREVLAQEGLSLGGFAMSQEHRGSAELPEGEAPDAASSPPAPRVTSPTRAPRHEGRIDVEA